MTPGPKERLVASTITLVRERGVHGTGLADVLEHSGTARASVYQHFPDGKSALVAEAVRTAGRHLESIAVTAGEQDPPARAVAMVEALLDWWAREIERHGGALGCPIAAAAVDADPVVREAAHDVFDRLHARLADAAEGRPGAGVMLSALEGAVLRSRVSGDTAALEEVRRLARAAWGLPPHLGQ